MRPDERQRILFLAPFPPRLDGVHGGSRAIAHVIFGLAERNRVALLHAQLEDEPPVDEVLGSACEHVRSVPVRFGSTRSQRWRRRFRVATGLLRGRPRWASNWSDPEYSLQLEELLTSWRPHIVQAEFHVMGQYLLPLSERGFKRVLVEHEPGITRVHDQPDSHGAIARLLSHLERRAWRRFEAAIIAAADAVVVFTERDRHALGALSGRTPITTIPIPIDVPMQPLNPAGSPPARVIFIGNFAHPPNVDAALRLVGSIFPRIRKARPDTYLEVVGPKPPRHVFDTAGPGVTVTGYVADVRPHLDRAAIVAVPLRFGSGMRVKVLEALAAGKAIVASPLAVEGIGVTDRKEVRLASTDQEFADAILELLTDSAERVALAIRARAWAADNLDPAKVVAAYEDLYRVLVSGSFARL